VRISITYLDKVLDGRDWCLKPSMTPQSTLANRAIMRLGLPSLLSYNYSLTMKGDQLHMTLKQLHKG
jgi:hypothetical protein